MSVFSSLYAGQYDQLYSEKSYGTECDLIEKATHMNMKVKPTTILDVGCGTGAHAIELAKRGYRVTGVDLSQPMLEHAKHKANELEASKRPEFFHGDARSFDLNKQYDVVIMMFAVVGYLTTNEDVLAGLRNVRRHLKPGGLFVCDFWYGPSVLSVRPTDRVRVIDVEKGRVIRAASTQLDISNHTADVTFRLWSLQGDVLAAETVETHRMRYFFPQEFSLFLSAAQMKISTLSAFPTLEMPLSDNTWNAVAVASAI
jgi:ubiquinone/menaquinone biosynthesis C-methylase UbiE